MLLIRDWMSPDPVVISPDTQVNEAMKMMHQGGFRRLPIMHQRQLVGIVSDRDLRSALPSEALPDVTNETKQAVQELTVNSIMSNKLITVTPEEPIELAAMLMELYKIGSLPVLDGEKLVGIITVTDVLHALVELLDLRQREALVQYQARLAKD